MRRAEQFVSPDAGQQRSTARNLEERRVEVYVERQKEPVATADESRPPETLTIGLSSNEGAAERQECLSARRRAVPSPEVRLGLEREQLGVQPVVGHQGLVVAVLDHTSGLDDVDAVG